MKTVAIDTECYYDNDVSIRPLGAWAYVRHPKADHYLMSVHDGSETWVGHPSTFNWESLRSAGLLVAHNMSYDEVVLERLVELGVAPAWVMDIPRGCTADLSAYNHSGRSLVEATRNLVPDMEKPVNKAMRSWMKGRTWADAEAAGKADELKEYAANDARACFALWERLSQKFPPTERLLSSHTRTLSRRGITTNLNLLESFKLTLEKARWEAEKRIPWSDENPPLSPKQLDQACSKANIPTPASTAEDSPECEAWEAAYGDMFDWVAAMRDYRKTNKLLKQVTTVLRRTRGTDGRMGVNLKYFGAATGRWSGESGFNMQNLPRDASYGVNLREVFMGSPGHVLVVCDLSQIEPRCLAWLSKDQALLEAVRSGFPIYEAHARATMGWTGGPLKSSNKDLYSLAKARVLGLGYGAGAARFVSMAKVLAGVTITPEESERIVKEFRNSNPAITRLWRTMDNALRMSRGGVLETELPSGRVLRQFDVAKVGGDYVSRQWMNSPHRKSYGALAVENLVQATARDVFGEALLRVEEKFPVVMHVHDELVCEVPEKDAESAKKEIVRLMCQTPAWLPGCPIEAEAVVSKHYIK